MRGGGEGGGTYIAFDFGGDARDLLRVRDVTFVVRDAAGLAVLHVLDVEHGDGGATHAVDFGDQQAEARGAAGDDNDLLREVDLARQAKGQAVVDGEQDPGEGDEGGPGKGHEHGRGAPGHVLGAEA